MYLSINSSCLRVSALGFFLALCSGSTASAENLIPKSTFVEAWKRQAMEGERFFYPNFVWHLPEQQRIGWMDPERDYLSRGSESWKAAFTILEKRSDSEALVEVSISKTKESLGAPGESELTKVRFLFRGFDVSDRQAGEPLKYVGGIIGNTDSQADRLKNGEVGLPIIEPATFPALPKHKAELGVGIRTWVDNTGNHKVEAAFESVDDGKVVLVTQEGRRIEVPLERLSAKDRLVVEPPPVPPRRRPKRTSVSRNRRSPPRSKQSFQEGLNAKLMNGVRANLNYDIRAMNQGFYRAGQTMQRIQSQLKMRLGNGLGR